MTLSDDPINRTKPYEDDKAHKAIGRARLFERRNEEDGFGTTAIVPDCDIEICKLSLLLKMVVALINDTQSEELTFHLEDEEGNIHAPEPMKK